MISKIMRLYNRFRRQRILNNKVANKIFSSFRTNVIGKILSHKDESYIQQKSLLFLIVYAYLYLYYLLFKYIYKYGGKYISAGIVYIFISIMIIANYVYPVTVSFIDTLQFAYLLYIIPFIMLSLFFIFKAIGYYNMEILKDKRRDIKKALIFLSLFQFSLSISTFPFLLATIPIAISEWYPKKTFKYLKSKLDEDNEKQLMFLKIYKNFLES